MQKKLLKKDLFGEIWRVSVDSACDGREFAILRDTRTARWWLAWIARYLLRRESKSLAMLAGMDGVPQLLKSDKHSSLRSYLAGVPMHDGRPQSALYFRNAAKLLRRLHCADIVHNDLAKEANILLRDDGSPAFIDFQLAAFYFNNSNFFCL